MSITIAYNLYQHNWYVGEIYHAFAQHMSNLYTDVKIVSLQDMAADYHEPMDTRHNTLASVFNIYNMIVHNSSTNKSFMHSLADYAPVLLEHTEALNKLNVIAFAFCSQHTSDVIDRYKHLNINLIPSFYILENWNDHEYINQYKNSQINDQCYFNGLCYGHRQLYVNHLGQNSFFVMRNKSQVADYKHKPDYYQELSLYKYGLSINGVAQICYRDLEYFGMGTLCIREPMNLITKDQLSPDVHYKVLLDSFVTNNIYYPDKATEVANYIVDKIHSITPEEKQFIINNAYTWFENNAKPIQQINFLHDCLVQNEIL